ncbi:MAG: gamma-glutamyltransferase family protein [Acidobacteria bacterium]|nr:gamma-glutamyltransferase family protein [Acidobacteriota bacterium]
MTFRLALLTLASAAAALAQYTMFPAVRGTREMVGAANNFEVEAGYRMLMAGGNAVDAGVASVLAAAVTEQARFGLGGEMPLIIKMAGKPPIIISGVGTAPKLATADYYRKRPVRAWEDPRSAGRLPSIGIEAAILPGVVDGLLLALAEYGTKSFAEVSAPAIEYARQFPIGEEFSAFVNDTGRILDMWPTSKAFFFPGGKAPQPGMLYPLPALARTLERMAEAEKKARGDRKKRLAAVHDIFYKGAIAKEIADFSEKNGGLIRYEDLAGYKAEIDQPVTGAYRGFEIIKPGFWTQGPVMIQALNILEGYNLKAMGHNSPDYLHTVVEAAKLAFADRDAHYGDPKFSKIPAAVLLSKEYAAERRKLIDPRKASLEHRPGAPGAQLPASTSSAAEGSAQDTTCVNVVDRQGNVFSATPSGAWLPSVIAGDTGIPYSSRLQSFVLDDGHANQLAPGKRPRVTLSPTLVLRDGKPYFAMSTPGGDNQDQAMLQVVLNLLDFQMTSQEAVEAPRFQSEHLYPSLAGARYVPGGLSLESRLPRPVIEAMQERGHKVTVKGPWSNGSAPTVIKMDGGVLEGGADPRRGRFIFGR